MELHSIAWCQCGDELRNCGLDEDALDAAREAGIQEDDLITTYWCPGCEEFYVLHRLVKVKV